ncbi:hypothetical protein RB195_003559 [Necator americanus]|uniref:Ground-like domain-containing protein n=1 Tax=Necator americanus TaxID=51031 RepID=A0ABR1DP34_NECAM
MYFSFLFHFFVVMFLIAPIFSCGFGLGGGGGGCCCGGGGGRKKRSVDDQLEQRFHADDGDKLCSSPEMKQILRKHMTKDPVTSKTNLVNALYQEGDHFFVVCSTGDSVYSAPRSSIFCSSNSTSFNHTCYVFGL